MIRVVVLAQYRRVTDGQTDRIVMQQHTRSTFVCAIKTKTEKKTADVGGSRSKFVVCEGIPATERKKVSAVDEKLRDAYVSRSEFSSR